MVYDAGFVLSHMELLLATAKADCRQPTACKAKGLGLCKSCGRMTPAALKNRGALTPDERKQMATYIWRNPRMSYLEIGLEWLVSRSTVNRVVKEFNISRIRRPHDRHS